VESLPELYDDMHKLASQVAARIPGDEIQTRLDRVLRRAAQPSSPGSRAAATTRDLMANPVRTFALFTGGAAAAFAVIWTVRNRDRLPPAGPGDRY
jgi:hypothetical protein